MLLKKTASATALLLALLGHAYGQNAQFTITRFEVQGATLMQASAVEQILSAYTGQNKSLDDVNAAAEALRKAYEAAGFPVVKVFPPAQTASDGQIKLQVVEGQIQSVTVKGNQAYDETNIRGSLPPLQEKVKPNAKQIVAAIAAANENPAKQVAVNFQSAEEVGQIDAVVNVTEDRPQKFTVGYDNMGATSTGVNRINVGYQNANLFNRDHMATIQFGTSLDYPSKSQQLSAGYRLPFYEQGLSLDVIGAISRSSANTNVGFGSTQFSGRGYMLGTRVNQALPSAGEYRHRLIYGFDFKDFDNTCRGTAAGTCGTVTALPASLTYFGALNAPEIQLSGGLSLAVNVPGGPHGGKDEYALARGGAEPSWNALRANSSLILPLPVNLQFRAGLAGQWTRDRLVPGEQFGLGGANSVRGYVERTLAGDRGYSGNLEFYSPDFGKLIPGGTVNARALVFYDFGRLYNTDANLFGERQLSLSSVGAGLRFNLGRDLSVKFDVGFAQEKHLAAPTTGATRQQGDGYGHAAINLQF